MSVAAAATSDAAPVDEAPVDATPGPPLHDAKDEIECARPPAPAFLYSPPDSNDAAKTDATDSELSDLDEEPVLDAPPLAPGPVQHLAGQDADADQTNQDGADNDIGEVLPHHWSGNVPVFRPTMHQFSDFQRFMKKVDSYGMKSGIIKIIPPPEWKDAQPPLDDLVKHVKVREPIKQDIMGSNGTYRQVNILHGRSYNVPQWRQLCEQSEHQPPARRGERRANADKPKPPRSRAPAAPKSSKPSTPKKRAKGKSAKSRSKQSQNDSEERPMTPVSPKEEPRDANDEPVASIEEDAAADESLQEDDRPPVGRMGGMRQSKPKTQSVSARRKFSRREGSAMIDEAAFKDFDYRMDIADYTPERCEELERAYWKTLTYASPLYGADLMGTLFDDRTDIWNLNKLPNLLDVLGTKVPGVNTAYLYLGMWKATFAWHLEDVDLYSINYLHFGAPKQWYSISQADARRFEAAMKSIWPTDAKACDQFLRHKGFLISPHHLLQHYGIKVNKVVSYPGEFVVTYPYGYHSGYNLGYNCAEAVNFALDSWLPMGKIAKKCECAQAQDSVWINVYEIERKLRGEETEYETEDDPDDDADGDMSGLPTPPASHGVRFKDLGRKRKRGLPGKRDRDQVRRIKLRVKPKAEPPCCLCPNDVAGLDMLPTQDGAKAHRLCALYMPETYVETVDGKELICNVGGISKDRFDLKCLFCRSRRGACFQCSKKKCARAYHGTCAAAAGVFVEEQDVPVFVDDGTEFKERAFEFSCRFHRVRRDKKADGDALETDQVIRAAAQALKMGEICQFQYDKGDIFAGMVVENREDEHMVLINVLPSGDRVEVEWKWLLLPDPADFQLPKASAKAIPMPASRKAQDQLNARRLHDDKPKKDDVFADGYIWAEFRLGAVSNKEQAAVDFSKPDQTWHYLGKTSTDARAQYTEDPTKPRHNPKGNFLDTLPKPPKPPPKPAARARPPKAATVAGPAPGSWNLEPRAFAGAAVGPPGKPFAQSPKTPVGPHLAPLTYTPQRLAPAASHPPGHGAAFQHGSGAPQANYAQHAPANMAAPQARPPAPVRAGAPPQPRSSPAPYHTRPTWQVHSSVYYRYPFFQVNHNRDSSKYRTPYSPWGGFTNGYEGDLRAHLMARQSLLPPRPGQGQAPLPAPMAPTHGAPVPYEKARDTHGRAQYPMHQTTAMAPSPLSGAPNQTFRPAVKAHAVAALQHSPASHQASAPAPAPAPPAMGAPSQRTAQVGLPAAVHLALQSTKPAAPSLPKQSPVPLPANFLAAMGSPSSSLPPMSAAAAAPPRAWQAAEPARTGMQQTWQHRDAQHRDAHAAAFGTRPEAYSAHASSGSGPPPPRLPSMSLTPGTSDGSPRWAERPPSAGNSLGQQGVMQHATSQVATGQGPGPQQCLPPYRDAPTARPGSAGTRTSAGGQYTQEFPDVPGCESMKFVERMMENLKRASQRGADDGGH